MLKLPGAQADAAVFAERINGLSLPNRAVVKALFLSGAEIIPVDAGVDDGRGGGGDGAADVDGDGDGPEVRIDVIAFLLPPCKERRFGMNRAHDFGLLERGDVENDRKLFGESVPARFCWV